MTLQELKEYPLDKEYLKDLNERNVINKDHREFHQNKMKSSYYRKYEIFDMTHYGNDPRSNDDMLKFARCYIECNIYTDKQWNKYFIPAINKMIDYNNTFERWHPGYLIKDANGNLAIVENDYSEAFGGRNYTSLAICELDSNKNITYGWAWAKYENYCLVSKDPEIISENLEKIREHNSKIGDGAPICMNPELAKKLGFTSIHTYESAKAAGWEPKEGAIKL